MKETIKKAAAALFAEYGYAGTSLAQISEKVGIKKPSLYAHFKSKDHLFECIMEDAFDAETKRVEEAGDLHKLLQSYLFLYEEDALFRFLLTSSFFPPDFLKKRILEKYDEYLHALEEKVKTVLPSVSVHAEDAAVMYTIILDSLFVELCYGTRERSQKRLDTAWRVYEQAFMKGQKKR
jgi:AcrR family transcriptional regulator